MSRKTLPPKDGHIAEPESSDSDSLVPGTTESGATEPPHSEPGVAEVDEIADADTEPGTTESGADDVYTTEPGATDSGAEITEDLMDAVAKPTTEQIAEQVIEKISERIAKHVVELPSEEITERVSEQASKNASEHRSQHSTEHSTEHISEQNSQQILEPQRETANSFFDSAPRTPYLLTPDPLPVQGAPSEMAGSQSNLPATEDLLTFDFDGPVNDSAQPESNPGPDQQSTNAMTSSAQMETADNVASIGNLKLAATSHENLQVVSSLNMEGIETALGALETKVKFAHQVSQSGDMVGANVAYLEVLERIKPAQRADTTSPELAQDLDQQAHALLVDCLWNLANNLYILNEVEASIPHFKRLVSVQEARLGSDDDQLITPLLRLAIAQKRAGEAAESEETFQRSMALAKRVNPEGNLAPKEQKSESVQSEPVVDSAFVHPLAESSHAHDSSNESIAADTATSDDPEAEVLKYLFSDNAPAHVVKQMSEIKPNKPSASRSNVLNRSSSAPIDYEKGFIDRNPAATRLSDLDIQALGAIPSPDAMKTMFSEVTMIDPQSRGTRSSAFLKANEGGDEPVKFADSVKRFDSNTSAPFMVRNKWFLPTAIVAVAVIAIGFVAKNFASAPRNNGAPVNLAAQQPDKLYASFDKQVALQTYKNTTVANYILNDKSHRATAHFLSGDPRDFLTVIPGSFGGNDVWMQQTLEGLKLSDGCMLYGSNTPLNGVVKHMTEIAQSMQAYYGINHSYPTTPEQFQAAMNGTSYVNPFTHKGDPPKYFITYSSNLGTAAKKLEIKTESGENWINETSNSPGEIHCCSLIYEDPAGHKPVDVNSPALAGASGSGTDFFIRGTDVDGHFIAGNKPGAVFYIELNQGKSSELTDMLSGPNKPLDLSQKRILIAKDFSEQMLFLFLSGAVPAILLMGIGGGWFVQHQLYEEKDQLSQNRKKVVNQILIASSILLAIWLAICALG